MIKPDGVQRGLVSFILSYFFFVFFYSFLFVKFHDGFVNEFRENFGCMFLFVGFLSVFFLMFLILVV